MKKNRKVLIANRGEIAVRIARSAKILGFETVAIYSEADRYSEHVKVCDEAYFIGGPAPKDSYLKMDAVIEIALQSGASYIHPGFGFLSERAAFVKACEKAGLVFVGPSAHSMEIMGDKITARRTVDEIGVPRVPGSKDALKDGEEAKKLAKEMGYPVLLKATAGGGGKGMRRVDHEKEIVSAFEGASREALGAFGDGSMYLEKYILEPHHVEIQVFGDGKGGAIHLGERECSIQRRHQKVWEETPSPILNQYPATREKMFECALKATSAIKYAGAGTLEFIVDGKGDFYFLEMNTRLQVEHPITEWVNGVDLVAWQLQLACGEFQFPKNLERKGSSIEVRFYAEDSLNFLPAPGEVNKVQFGMGPFVRVDTAFTEKGAVSVHYDPMIAKISVWGQTREEAIARMRVALDETRVEPPLNVDGTQKGSLRTNIEFLRKLCRNKDVLSGNTTTDLIQRNSELTVRENKDLTLEAMVALAIYQSLQGDETESIVSNELASSTSLWNQRSRVESLR